MKSKNVRECILKLSTHMLFIVFITMLSSKAAMIIVIVNDEPTSLTDAYAYIKVTSRQVGPDRFRVIVNSANSVGEAKLTFQSLKTACQNFLQIEPKLLGIVRKDSKVADAIRHQTHVFDRWPECNASHDLGQLGRKLNKKFDELGNENPDLQ